MDAAPHSRKNFIFRITNGVCCRSLIRLIQLQFDIVRQRGVLLQTENDHRAVPVFGEINRLAAFDAVFDLCKLVS